MTAAGAFSINKELNTTQDGGRELSPILEYYKLVPILQQTPGLGKVINPVFAGVKGMVSPWKCLKMQFHFKKSYINHCCSFPDMALWNFAT